MSGAVLVLAFVALAIASTLVVVLLWDRRLPIQGRRILVNLEREDSALRGVLVSHRGSWLVFADVQMMQPDGSSVSMDGQVYVERPRIVFLQVLP